ncbi:MAG: LTA synthase family protein [Dehalobacterium sp.]
MLFAKNVINGLGASAVSIAKWTDSFMLIDLPFIFIIALKMKPRKRNIKKHLIPFSCTLLLCAAVIGVQFTQFEKSNMISDVKLYPLLLSPIGNHMYDLYKFASKNADKLDSDKVNAVDSWLKDNAKYQASDPSYANLHGLIKGKNIIAIHVESLENIMVNHSFYGQEITPNINRLLNSSIYFNNIHEQVKDGNSSDAELMVNASVYPISEGSAFLRFGENRYVTLPKLLKEEGYTTMAIHGDDKAFWNRDQVYPLLGYDKFVDEDQFDDKRSCGMGILDASLFAQTITEIKKINQPFFMSVITVTSHIPFTLDQDLKTLDLPYNDVTSDYLQCINYVDKVFGQFYDRLKAEGILDNTVLILYGDHEGIHKYYDTSLPDNNKEIPFMIIIPGFQGLVIDRIGGQIDIMPTLAYLLGIDKEKYAASVMGQNLFGSAPGATILSNGEILGTANDKDHLREAQKISDIIVKGNYFYAKESVRQGNVLSDIGGKK